MGCERSLLGYTKRAAAVVIIAIIIVVVISIAILLTIVIIVFVEVRSHHPGDVQTSELRSNCQDKKKSSNDDGCSAM